MTRGVIYARYSEGPKQTDQSIEGQVDDCRAYAAAHDIAVIKVYADRHVSGKSVTGRDEFLQMIDDAQDGKFDVVIVWKVDRFGRNREDIALNKIKLRKAGVKLLYAKENIPDSPEGILLESLMEGLAEYYSADLRQKVTRGHCESAKKGKFTVGALPRGYKKDADQHIVIDEEKAPAIREAFRMYVAGDQLNDIREYLFAHGVRGAHDSLPSKSVVYRMMRNEHYLGKFDFHGIVIPAPAIIDAETFAEAEKRSAQAQIGGGSGKAKVDYLLSCKCVCGYCGEFAAGVCGRSHTGTVYHYYGCMHCRKLKAIPQKALEDTVIRRTVQDVLTDDMISKIADRIMEIQQKEKDAARIAELKKEIASLKKKSENIVDAIAASGNVLLTQKLDDLTHQREQAEDELSRLEIEKPVIPRELIVSWIESFRSGDTDDPTVRKRIVKSFIGAIVLTNDEITIIYNVSDMKKARDPKEIAGSYRVSIVDPPERHSNRSVVEFVDSFIILRIPA